MPNHDYGQATEARITEVVDTCKRYGGRSIVALAGVPGTGKSFIATVAAQRLATDPLMVRPVQFHPNFSYEEFIEGYRANSTGGFSVEKGVFLDWNDQALDDGNNTYVFLIEELTRANLSGVLGELMTFVEYRDRNFTSIYSRRPVRIAPNLIILATFNPRDRSALELDDAVIRRLRIIPFPPDTSQLVEMLAPAGLPGQVTDALKSMFAACATQPNYEGLMPFGHGVFSEVKSETPDLYDLWRQRLEPLLYPAARNPHPFADVIAKHYPWRSGPSVTVVRPAEATNVAPS